MEKILSSQRVQGQLGEVVYELPQTSVEMPKSQEFKELNLLNLDYVPPIKRKRHNEVIEVLNSLNLEKESSLNLLNSNPKEFISRLNYAIRTLYGGKGIRVGKKDIPTIKRWLESK